MPPKASAEAAASHFLLSPDDIQITDTDLANPLGQGSYGIVYKGLHKRISVAVKQLLAPDLAARQLAEFKQEIALMASFHYDYIVRLYGFTEVKPYRIVMEFMAKGSLFQVLHSTEELSWTQRIQWGKEIAMGIDYLHTREPKIIHRDLKSPNILINGHNQAKLTDFGSAIAKLRTTTATLTAKSKKEKNETENKNLVGSTRWMAPELFENELDPTYTTATDIFAYAVVLWELAAREIPYSTVTEDARIERAILKGTRAKIDSAWPDIFQTLLPLCWHQDPQQRPSTANVIGLFEKATSPEPIDPAIRDAYIDSLIKPIYEDFLKKVAALMAVHHTIFISYAWPKLPEEKELQLFLARLYDDFTQHLQLDVIWDLKSLKPGMDIEEFMRRGVLDSYRVLMIGTPTYAERATDIKTNVHKEVTHMARKRGIEKDSIIPLLYCGQWANAFPRGYNQVLAVTASCDRHEHFYKNITNILYALLGLIEEDKHSYNEYAKAYLAKIGNLIANITEDQLRAFQKEKLSQQHQKVVDIQKILTHHCHTLSQEHPDYQPDALATLKPNKSENTKSVTTQADSEQKQAAPITSASQGHAPAPEVPAKKSEPAKSVAAKIAERPAPAKPAKAAVSQTDVEKLLLHVARGEQDEAEAMLKIKGNKALLLKKGKVTDYSNRTFNNITAFQYALWALDWHMWKMLLKYLPKDEAAQQLRDLETNKTEHGQQYDFTPLIHALKTYVDNYDPWTLEQCRNHWIKVVGGAQTKVPAHVANEYCRPDRAFDPKPSFTEDQLPRTFDIYEDNKFFPLSKYSGGALSSDFGLLKGDGGVSHQLLFVAWGVGGWTVPEEDDVAQDRLAITGLCEIRTEQYQALKHELTMQLDARPRLDQAEVDLSTLKPDLEHLSFEEKTKKLETKPVTTSIEIKTKKSPFDDIDDIFASKIISPVLSATADLHQKTACLFGDDDSDDDSDDDFFDSTKTNITLEPVTVKQKAEPFLNGPKKSELKLTATSFSDTKEEKNEPEESAAHILKPIAVEINPVARSTEIKIKTSPFDDIDDIFASKIVSTALPAQNNLEKKAVSFLDVSDEDKEATETIKPAASSVKTKVTSLFDNEEDEEEFTRSAAVKLLALPDNLSTSVSHFFAPTEISPVAVSKTGIETLLLHVARGEQDQAEVLLKGQGNKSLLLHKEKVTDYSNRTFHNITAFQYALWALDWHMWKMLMKYLPKDEAALQLQDLETNKTEHGQHYDFTPLIQALTTYADNYKSWTMDQRKNHWIKVIGDAQMKVPAHVANEYCRPDRSFDPKPPFSEAFLPRTFNLDDGNKFFPLPQYFWSAFTRDFGVYRSCYRLPRNSSCLSDLYLDGTVYPSSGDPIVDLPAITGLYAVRTAQYQALKQELSAQAAATFFAPQTTLKKSIDQVAVEKLLLHVARGEQDQAEEMLKIKNNEMLLSHKGKVTDYSNRTFNNITAFQYALWALDWHMWKMLRKYLSDDEAARQLQDLEINSTTHGKHYDFTPLIQALDTYIDRFNRYNPYSNKNNWNILKNLWVKKVGGAQMKAPAHVANEYCHPHHSYSSCYSDYKPLFTQAKLPRTFDLSGNNKFFPLSKYSRGLLATDFAIYRGSMTKAWGWNLHSGDGDQLHDEITVGDAAKCYDRIAISDLCEVRTRQYQELKDELTARLSARPR